MITVDSKDIERELLTPAEYSPETRGKRRLPAAVSAGEWKYSIVKPENHTELAYVLELPKTPGPTQKEFEIKKEASYILSVKNPDINTRGIASLSDKKPQYPDSLRNMFDNRR